MAAELALDGGRPVRSDMLPYGRQSLDEDDIAAVVRTLRSDWLTTGPAVGEFEAAFAAATGAAEAVAVSSGTAALHAAMFALEIGPGDEVVVPPMTFAATANCVLYQGATPVFADVDPETLLIDPAAVEARLGPRTKAIIAVDYAGQPCDYAPLRNIADRNGLAVVADACHSLGGTYGGGPVGSLADLSAFSLHPVKNITTGEGGVVTTNDPRLAERMRGFRSHGITSDHRQRDAAGSWHYEMVSLGYNYRLTDLQCALGTSQLSRLGDFVDRRQRIDAWYRSAFESVPGVVPVRVLEGRTSGCHLFVVQLGSDGPVTDRDQVFSALRAEGIGVNVHYIPVHLHPYYRERLGTGPGDCPVAEAAFQRILTLPLFPGMTRQDMEDVVMAVRKVTRHYAVSAAAGS